MKTKNPRRAEYVKNQSRARAMRFEVVRGWAEAFDHRALSDEALHWADDEAELVTLPENVGEWKASMALAFEAGRFLERSPNCDLEHASRRILEMIEWYAPTPGIHPDLDEAIDELRRALS